MSSGNDNANTVDLMDAPVQCVKIIYGYMGFATFMIFFFMTGGIFLDVLQTVNIHIDAISVVFLLYNFSIVGSTILFFTPAPLLLKQVRCSPISAVIRPAATACSSQPAPANHRASGTRPCLVNCCLCRSPFRASNQLWAGNAATFDCALPCRAI